MSEIEPKDSRNVTGTASTADGRWTNKQDKPPKGVPNQVSAGPGKPSAQAKPAE